MPPKKINRGLEKIYCDVQCKNEYNRHGSAFGPLKTRLEKLVTKLTRQEVKKLTARIVALEHKFVDAMLDTPDYGGPLATVSPRKNPL